MDLTKSKSEVKGMVVQIISNRDDSDVSESECESESSEGSDADSDDENDGGGKSGGGGWNKQNSLSPQLAEFLCVEKCSRPEIVKRMWAYIRENSLQNPNDKRQIVLDDKLYAVFKVRKFTMFQMNKFISKHVYVEEVQSSPSPKAAAGKKKKTSAPKKGKAPVKKKGAKADRKPANQPKHNLSPELVAVVGCSQLSRQQVVKGLWEYIRSNELQNPNDKRQIICDTKLKKVMGGQKTVTMFSMNKFLSPHLLEKV